ncbi:MAG: hypothetical protein EBZ77_09210 [Chitinophagia bacterium]|nr:hypothetical protein [Chitinophagia bacterium]
MKITFNNPTDVDAIFNHLMESLPQYIIEIKKNPLLGFRYVEVRKNGFVGAWVNYKEKNNTATIVSCVPSVAARAFLGGLLLYTINYFNSRQLVRDTSAALAEL